MKWLLSHVWLAWIVNHIMTLAGVAIINSEVATLSPVAGMNSQPHYDSNRSSYY